LARKAYGRLALDPKPVIPFSPCTGRIKIKEWPTEKYLEYWAATPGTRESKLFIEEPSERLSRAILALNRERCTLVTGLVTGHCTLRWHLHFTSLSDNSIGKCEQEEEFSHHILCQHPALEEHKMKIFSFA
jgi:hypothetical protein